MAVPTFTTAKNIDFARPGAGLEGYDITPQNIGAKYVKLFAARGNQAGGSAQMWAAIQKNSDRSVARAPTSVAAAQFAQFRKDGKWPTAPSPQFLRDAAVHLDYAFRETGRSAQHKQGFLDSFLGQLVVLVAEIAAGVVTMGAAVPAMIGAGIGFIRTHSLTGAIMGGISGYAAGSLGAFVGAGGIGASWAALTAPSNGAGITALGGGTGTANFLTNAALGVGAPLGHAALTAASIGFGLAQGGKPKTPGVGGPGSFGSSSSIQLPNSQQQPKIDAQAIRTKAQTMTSISAVPESRVARRDSWVAEGAHTGAGDPRNLGLRSPQAVAVGGPGMVLPPARPQSTALRDPPRIPVAPSWQPIGPMPVRRAA